MKLTIALFALAMGMAVRPAMAQEAGQHESVRASEPTVVTIVGSQDRIDLMAATQPEVSRIQPAKQRRSVKTWNRFVDFAGWSLNAGDVIPSNKERSNAHFSKQHRSAN